MVSIENQMKIVIVGCGRIGASVARALSLLDHSLAVIDCDPKAFRRLGPTFKGKTVVGHALDRAVLEEADIALADGLAAVTNCDEVNTLVALLARQHYDVPKLVARLHDPHRSETYKRLGLATLTAASWGKTRESKNASIHQLCVLKSRGPCDVDLVELEIPSTLAGRSLVELTNPQEVHAAAVQRAGEIYLSAQEMPLQAGDTVYIAALTTTIDRLRAQLVKS